MSTDTDHEQDDNTHRIPVNKRKTIKGEYSDIVITPLTDQDEDDLDELTALEGSMETGDAATSEPTVVEPTEPKEVQPDAVEPAETPSPKPQIGNRFNKYFLYTLVAGLVISALISIVAVLFGGFNSTVARALGTTASMVVHTFIALFLVSHSSKSSSKSSGLLTNTLLFITIASFITTVLNIWEVIPSQTAGDLYLVYFYTFLASLWTKLLLKVGEYSADKPTRVASRVSIGFTGLFYLLLLPTVFTHYSDTLPDLYYRIMAATVIALATSSVLTTVSHRIYLFKHPELKSQPSHDKGWDILVACIVLLFGLPIIFMLIVTLSSRNVHTDYEQNAVDTPASIANQKTAAPQSNYQSTYYPDKESDVEDCSKLPEFRDPKVLQYATTYTFQSHDPAGKHIIASWSDTGTKMSPIIYEGTLSTVDKHCKRINITTLKPDDRVKFYLHTDYANLYEGALAIIQKVD